ncbi:MAG: hypothetical protein QOD92_486 [Acidimicrobiaceae bacterium]|jgi:hypothetical protein
MSEFEIRVSPLESAGGTIRASATLRSPTRRGVLWYEFDESHRAAIVDRADPFVLSTLILAMHEGRDLHVFGAPASTSLLRNLEEFQRIWHAWFGLPIVDLVVEGEREAARPDGAVVAFSGGVDSAFSAYSRTRGAARRGPDLRAALMLHGMDIPRADREGFDGARRRSERMLRSLGLDLITVRTNAWELLPNADMHSSALGVAAALQLLGGGFGAGLLPSTATYSQLVLPLDSTPMSDWLLGSASFEIIHDGAAYNRLEKVRRLSEWDEALDNLRVCLEDPGHDRNCGQCRKCLLTYLAFQVLDVEPRCFETVPSPAAVRAWAGSFTSHRLFVADMRAIVAEADRRGLQQPWIRAAKRRLRVISARRAVTALSPALSRRAAQVAWKVRRR